MITQFLQFASVGAIGTAVQYGVLYGLVEWLGSNPVLASAIGMILGAITNYILNYVYTFNSTKKHAETAPKFFTVAAFGLALNTSMMALAIQHWQLHYLLAQVLSTLLVLVWNFLANRYWTFREPT